MTEPFDINKFKQFAPQPAAEQTVPFGNLPLASPFITPLNNNITIASVQIPGEGLRVILIVHDQSGTHVTFISAEAARNVADQLRQAASGLAFS
jgi:hypothetical protein